MKFSSSLEMLRHTDRWLKPAAAAQGTNMLRPWEIKLRRRGLNGLFMEERVQGNSHRPRQQQAHSHNKRMGIRWRVPVRHIGAILFGNETKVPLNDIRGLSVGDVEVLCG